MDHDLTTCVDTGITTVFFKRTEESAIERKAILTRDFGQGEAIFINTAFQWQLHATHVKERCGYCFCSAKADDKLRRCSRCQEQRYCSKACQQADHTATRHKVDCKRFDKAKKYGFEGETLDKLLLLMKTAKSLLDEKRDHGIDSKCSIVKVDESGEEICKCGLEHAGSQSFSGELTGPETHEAKVINEMTKVATALLFGTSELENKDKRVYMDMILHMFDENNFAITDELCNPIGTGIYPHAAILNHSCEPNAVMRYSLIRGRPPSVVCVALRDMKKGEELTHSYCDLTFSYDTRQEHLREVYRFSCMCDRCSCFKGPSKISEAVLKIAESDLNALAFSPCAFRSHLTKLTCSSEVQQDPGYLDRLTETLTKAQAGEAGAKATFFVGDLGMSSSTRQWCDRWQSMSKERPFDRGLYEATAQVFTELMYRCLGYTHGEGEVLVADGDGENAFATLVQCGALITTFLDLTTRRATPAFPMLGLHLFTFADIVRRRPSATGEEPVLGEREFDSGALYRWALEIMATTHGERSHLVAMLRDNLRDVPRVPSAPSVPADAAATSTATDEEQKGRDEEEKRPEIVNQVQEQEQEQGQGQEQVQEDPVVEKKCPFEPAEKAEEGTANGSTEGLASTTGASYAMLATVAVAVAVVAGLVWARRAR